MHKWWAQRLGSVFRATIIGSLVPAETSVLDLFYGKTDFEGCLELTRQVAAIDIDRVDCLLPGSSWPKE